ncbi:hypothetical protein [Brevundimonas sp. BAL3]|uniref:hypothetical protein n=1 Tax=Brevundimonas sp. BAL3 TaxID=391600 RepID=UPI00058FA3C1|nr:hypothetical protein [Brevundimonas sp. BAL3]
MEILAHRGWWLDRAERNTRQAFERAFAAGFGVETDVRDHSGRLVIAHDPATEHAMSLDVFLDTYESYPTRPTLALNIKADGLTEMVNDALAKRGIDSYFVFDMSVPDTLHYLRAGLRTYLRRSEHESPSPLEDRAQGIWLDDFTGGFASPDQVISALASVSAVALVSPELHGRPHARTWSVWRDVKATVKGRLAICTDFPDAAAAYFSGEMSS